MWVLELKLVSSATAASTVNCRAMSTDPGDIF